MFIVLFLTTLALGNPEPIHVKLGDPILNLKVNKTAKENYALNEIFNEGFCFFLTLDCGYCRDAMAKMKDYIPDDVHVVVLFRDKPNQANLETIQQMLDSQRFDIYFVEQDQLSPYNIKTFPAVLGYQNGRLKLGYHGPIDSKKANMLVDMLTR